MLCWYVLYCDFGAVEVDSACEEIVVMSMKLMYIRNGRLM